ncbi:MAG: hypothetical protein PHV32_02360 [Eubacteriales bacterium]|nr:hypothetical protein [Eubacteriales bacterium]
MLDSIKRLLHGGFQTMKPALLIERLINIIGFFFSIMISERLLGNPFYGVSVYIISQLLLMFPDILGKQNNAAIPTKVKKRFMVSLPFILAAILSLLLLYPILLQKVNLIYMLIFSICQFAVFGILKFGFRKFPYFIIGLTPVVLLFSSSIEYAHSLIQIYSAAVFLLLLLRWLFTKNKPVANRSIIANSGYSPDEITEMMKVNSFHLYWLMNANTKIAFEISLLLLACYLPYLPYKGFWSLIAVLSVLILLYSIASALSKFILRKKRIHELGKNSIYIIFCIIWIITNYYLYYNYTSITAIGFYALYLILCTSITALAFLSIAMESDMQIIGTLGVKNFTMRKYEIFKSILDYLSSFYSRITILIIITLLTFFAEFNPYKSSGILFAMGKYGIILVPVVFLVLGIATAVRLPLTKLYELKLKKYVTLKREGRVNKPLEERLKLVLVEKYSKKVGLRILLTVLKPFFYHKVIGKANVNTKRFPSIFVCNHSQIYGPIAAILNMPFFVRPWIANNMIDSERVSGHIQRGTFDRQEWIPKPLRDRMGKIMGPVVTWAMKSTNPIPVFRKGGRKALLGIELSVDALEEDDNLLIFPENPLKTSGYVSEGVGEFFSGFVNIARDYNTRTKKSVTFYSVFANKSNRTLSMSKGITFDPSAPFREEKERITNYLHDAMVELSNM